MTTFPFVPSTRESRSLHHPVLFILGLAPVFWGSVAFAHVAFVDSSDEHEWVIGSTVDLTWQDTVPHDTVNYTLELVVDDSNEPILIDSVPAGTHSYAWTVPDMPCDPCSVKVTQVNESAADYMDSLEGAIVQTASSGGTGGSGQVGTGGDDGVGGDPATGGTSSGGGAGGGGAGGTESASGGAAPANSGGANSATGGASASTGGAGLATGGDPPSDTTWDQMGEDAGGCATVRGAPRKGSWFVLVLFGLAAGLVRRRRA